MNPTHRYKVIMSTTITVLLFAATITLSSAIGFAQTANPQDAEAIYTGTAAAEMTAIAVFTQNPKLALSSTPYYVEIIANEIVRQATIHPRDNELTATAIISQLTQTWTPTPTIPTTPTPSREPVCDPAIQNWAMTDKSLEMDIRLADVGLDASAGIVSVGVVGIDGTCDAPFMAYQTTFSILIETEDDVLESDPDEMARLIMLAFTVLSEMEFEPTHIAPNPEIDVIMSSDSGGTLFYTDYESAMTAVAQDVGNPDLWLLFDEIIRTR